MSSEANSPSTTFSKLKTISWITILLSLLIDTSHVRAFPSYNILVGIFGLYIVTSFADEDVHVHGDAEDQTKPKRQDRLFTPESLLVTTAAYSTITLLSIVVDVVYSICWGGEILDSDSASAVFSLVLFFVNIFIKVVGWLYASAIQVNASEEYSEKASSNRSIAAASMKSTSGDDVVPMQEVDVAGQENVSQLNLNLNLSSIQQHHQSDFNTPNAASVSKRDISLNHSHSDLPIPPFTPGVAGLVSPYPRKETKMTPVSRMPPTPPMRKR